MAVVYKIDLNEKGRYFPHYWELSVGSCHAATLLRADVQEHLRKAHRDIGFQYVRCHGLLNDDMSVVIAPMFWGDNQIQISFFNIDRMIDFLLEIDMKPFLEIGFMPEAYASTSQTTFHYRGFTSMPKDDEKWIDLIRKLTAHLEERYGVSEVSSWFFEIWNEPNLRFFFDGSMKDYFHLYEMTARTIKSVNPAFRVGGPATSNNMWISELIEFCHTNEVPLDFITTHHYPSDDPLSRAGMNGADEKALGMDDYAAMSPEELKSEMEKLEEMIGNSNNNPRDVLYQTAKQVKEEAGDYPVYYTEWHVGHYDTNYAAAGVLATLAYNENLVEGYSYWCVSDIFEEMGLHGLPFNNEFGLLNVYGNPKPVYRLFESLHEAGNQRLNVEAIEPSRTAEVMALTDGHQVMVFAYNHDIEARDIKAEEMEILLKGKVKSVQKAVIDANTTAPIKKWEEMGRPAYLNRNQIVEIEAASCLIYEDQKIFGEDVKLTFTAGVESVTIYKISLG